MTCCNELIIRSLRKDQNLRNGYYYFTGNYNEFKNIKYKIYERYQNPVEEVFTLDDYSKRLRVGWSCYVLYFFRIHYY